MMKAIDIYGNKCPTLFTLDIINGKWRVPLLWKISYHGPIRFNTLRREVTGITNIMLSKILQEYEEYGIVTRTQYEEIPPRVEYSLTASGQELVTILDYLHEWGNKNMDKPVTK